MSIDDATPSDWDLAYNKSNEFLEELMAKERKREEGLKETKSEAEYWGSGSSCNVDKPAHYNNGGIEAIEYIHQQLGAGFTAYCEGNVMKYLHRWKYKNGVEDLKKAQWYLNRMIEAEEE